NGALSGRRERQGGLAPLRGRLVRLVDVFVVALVVEVAQRTAGVDGREADHERCPGVVLTHLDRAAVADHDLAGDGQAEAVPARATVDAGAGRVEAREPLEHALAVRG